jgi:hypothetical protein
VFVNVIVVLALSESLVQGPKRFHRNEKTHPLCNPNSLFCDFEGERVRHEIIVVVSIATLLHVIVAAFAT